MGQALADRRDDAFLATKGGLIGELVGGRPTITRNGRPEHLREAVDASLRRLQTDHIDLYQLHRVDPDVPVEESWGAMAEAVEAGKVLALGHERGDGRGARPRARHPPRRVPAVRAVAVDPRRRSPTPSPGARRTAPRSSPSPRSGAAT